MALTGRIWCVYQWEVCDISYRVQWVRYIVSSAVKVCDVSSNTVKVYDVSYRVLWQCAMYRIEYSESVWYIVSRTMKVCGILYGVLWECDISYRVLWTCAIYRIEYYEIVRYIVSSTVTVCDISYRVQWVCDISYRVQWQCALYRIEYSDSVRYIASSTVTVCDISHRVLWQCAIYSIEYCERSHRGLYLTSLIVFGRRAINQSLNTPQCQFAPTKSRISRHLSRCTQFQSVSAQTANAAALSAAKQRPSSCTKSSTFLKPRDFDSNLIQAAVFGTKYRCAAVTPLMLICSHLLHSIISPLHSFDCPSRLHNCTL